MSAEIRPIDPESVQRIVAGQAVFDLSTALKELVDNALDAKSRTINIRLFNLGIDILEVSDDGMGVPLASRPYLATPHATSKIRAFDEIYATASTLGFRGEALFCLANLSTNLIVATRTRDEATAQKLEFRRDGSLRTDTVTSILKKVGTTVAVVGLMDALPVRRHDLIKGIQTQRRTMLRMLEGYAIFSPGVGFRLMDMMDAGRGGESLLLATPQNSSSIEETVSATLGPKVLPFLCPIQVDFSTVLEAPVPNLSPATTSSNPPLRTPTLSGKMEGLISKAKTQSPRNSQYFAINGRPVELKQVSRVLNEAWRALGCKKRPFCALQFTLPNNEYDINLSPDKRTVMLTHEPQICALVRDAVVELWASQTEGQFVPNDNPVGPVFSTTAKVANESLVTSAHSQPDTTPESPRCRDEAASEDEYDEDESPIRFNRRYAFTNSASNARMQHEYDDGRRIRIRNTTPLPNLDEEEQDTRGDQESFTDSTATPLSIHNKALRIDTQHEEESTLADHPTVTPPPTTPLPLRASAEDETVTTSEKQNAVDTSSPLAVNNNSHRRLTETERRRWMLTQRQFNHAGVPSSEEQLLQHALIVDEVHAPVREPNTSTGMNDENDINEPEKRIQAKSYSLEHFGFQATKTSTPLSTSTPHEEPYLEPLEIADTPVPHDGSRRQVVDLGLTHSQSDKLEDEKILETKRTRSRTMSDGTASDFVRTGLELESPEPSPRQKRESKTVVWESFAGTQSVAQAAVHERINMVTRKRKLQAVQQSQLPVDTTSVSERDNDNSALPNQTLRLFKEDFAGMTVIGQFNMGFILARSRDHHLWILDQHACDEKYNFEKLCAETIIHEQKLIAPMPLELSPAEESCVVDNLEIFEKNGFRFLYDPEKPPRHRLALTALPHSGAQAGRKAVQFGKDDVSALCAILSDDGEECEIDGGTGADGSGLYGNNAVRRYAGAGKGSGDTAGTVFARLPKAIAMFASRACRTSIMIGKALSQKEMERVVKRLGDVEHPWNCPHGRPTMQHAKGLHRILMEDEAHAAEHFSGPTMTVASQEQQEFSDAES